MPGEQLSLLDWAPTSPVARFEDGAVRAQTITGRICRAIAVALHDCAIDRREVASRMSTFLGARISANTLNDYACQARADRVISLPRFVALLTVTRDRRLLEMIAEPLGWVVVERCHLNVIELAQLREKRRELGTRAVRLERLLARGAR